MDTRTKLLSDLSNFNPLEPLLVVTGRFDILRAEMARDLAAARQRTGAQTVLAVIRPLADALAPVDACAELAAALRAVDYVFVAPTQGEFESVVSLCPAEFLNLDEDDRRRIRQLIEHVQSLQTA